jgi:flavin reductase (DIM6/NTAB) family NADH-FMN oxidoreductase RutF
MRQVDYMKVAEKAMAGIRQGAFLTVKSGEGINTMTIGWATIGFVWQRPILMVAVRLSRHTFTIIEEADDFTVSIPSSDMGKAIAFCGTKSGRDFDKFKECNLRTAESRKVLTPIIEAPGLHFECKIVYRSAMDPAGLDGGYDARLYPEKDYHTIYFGEIMDCYEID